MELFAIEVRTRRWSDMIAWYAEVMRMKTAIRSPEDGYALLVGPNWRLALLQRSAVVTGNSVLSLAVEVADLVAERKRILSLVSSAPDHDISRSDERFLEWTIDDPDGNRIKLFQFQTS